MVVIHLGPYHPDTPEVDIPIIDYSSREWREDEEEEELEYVLPPTSPGQLPNIIFGCSVFGYGIYAPEEVIKSDFPLRVIKYAMKVGVTAFDTSPWYHPSEIILGRVLADLRKDPKYKRESYTLITKVGKYGPTREDHTYDLEVVKKSVERSLKRLGTDYLDVVYLHDVEYIASGPFIPAGNPLPYLFSSSLHTSSSSHVNSTTINNNNNNDDDENVPSININNANNSNINDHTNSPIITTNNDNGNYNDINNTDSDSTPALPSTYLNPPYHPLGPGDLEILNSINLLRSLQRKGIIKSVGISGYPLPLLLRISLLILHQTGQPLDIVQTYAHQTLLNSSLSHYVHAFRYHAKVKQVISAAPLAMGLLTSHGGPTWHPVHSGHVKDVLEAMIEAKEVCERKGERLEDVAGRYGFRDVYQHETREQDGDGKGKEEKEGERIPVVVGCKSLEEFKGMLKDAKMAQGEEGREVEEEVREVFRRRGVEGYSWKNP
ncbi:hypothetical protein M231_07018 [Tremella mesenterica]|uniref:NADP-dependent oxidoreductase domain-containing protein n=1 Tax=Tremella mesenterica TaxID=5217 RepID=A0A4Q1BAD2_TREME|nr:hypothetical protein M231_07018 [Tremella mesenterica]